VDALTKLLGEVKDGALALVLSLPGRNPVEELKLARQEMALYVALIDKALEEHDENE
jgi:hypothetical protein